MKLKRPGTSSRCVQSQKNLPFQTFQALIETLGEFKIITDPNGRIDAIWNSFGLQQCFSRCLLGCLLDEVVDPQLMTQIRDLLRCTAILASPEELQCQVNLRGAPRWFSISAIPLDRHDSDSLVICLVARDVTHKTQALKERQTRRVACTRRAGGEFRQLGNRFSNPKDQFFSTAHENLRA